MGSSSFWYMLRKLMAIYHTTVTIYGIKVIETTWKVHVHLLSHYTGCQTWTISAIWEKRKWLQVSNIFGRSEKTELQHSISYFFIIWRQGQTLANTDILLAKFKYSGIIWTKRLISYCTILRQCYLNKLSPNWLN